MKVALYKSAHTFIYFIFFSPDYEVTPMFYMFNLAAGDKVIIPPFNEENNNWTPASNVMTGIGTSLTLRYLGAYVPHVQSTTQPPRDTTTDPYAWYNWG